MKVLCQATEILWVASNFESSIAQIFPTIILSTEDIQTSEILYPNPASDFLKIDQIENIKSMTIHDSKRSPSFKELLIKN